MGPLGGDAQIEGAHGSTGKIVPAGPDFESTGSIPRPVVRHSGPAARWHLAAGSAMGGAFPQLATLVLQETRSNRPPSRSFDKILIFWVFSVQKMGQNHALRHFQ
jgi:hypothetical protein